MTEKEYSFDDVYVSFDHTLETINLPKKEDEIMKKIVIKEGFERLKQLPQMQKKKKKPKEVELPEEVLTDLKVLKMRSVLDGKRFYKKNDTKDLAHDKVQIGHVMDSPLDFYSSRLPKKLRKKTLVDELLADQEFQRDIKRRYVKIIEEKPRKYRKEFRMLKKKNEYKRKHKNN